MIGSGWSMPITSISVWLRSYRMTGLSCESPAAMRRELWQRRHSIDAVRVRGIESLPRHHLPEASAEFLKPVPLHGGVPHRIKRPSRLPCSRLERAGGPSRQSQALMDSPCVRPRLQPVALHRHFEGMEAQQADRARAYALARRDLRPSRSFSKRSPNSRASSAPKLSCSGSPWQSRLEFGPC